MCTCVQKSKTPYAPGKGFHFQFTCTDGSGNQKQIELDASNDNLAKQLAELECSEGYKSLSFKDSDKLFSFAKSDDKIVDKDLQVQHLLQTSCILNPTTWTRLAQYGNGVRGCSIRMTGRWTPGIGHPYWDANGSDQTVFNGFNKWCVMIRIYSGNDIVATIPWTAARGGVMNIGNFGFPTAIVALMNDDMYEDNMNDSANPMTAIINFF